MVLTPGHLLRGVARSTRWVLLLAVFALVVPDAGPRPPAMELIRVNGAHEILADDPVVWILALGSDARGRGPGYTRSRADAIQLVGVNFRTGDATAIGIPRDSYVPVAGHGRDKINSSMYYGGPQLMADSVANMVGIRPDVVVVTYFGGFIRMVNSIGGVTVRSVNSWYEPVRPQGFHVGVNHLTGIQALAFSRNRHEQPNGDFDRSANQQRMLRGILLKVRGSMERAGFMERAVHSVLSNTDTNLRPAELYRFAQALTKVQPTRFRGCVVQGSTGYVGAASVVYPDIAQARSIAARARADAKLEGSC